MKMFKKRYLYYLSFLFIYIIPGILIVSKMFNIEEVDKKVSISFVGVILGLIYLVFISKKIKRKIFELKPSTLKLFLVGITNCIPFLTVGCICYLAETVLSGAITTVLCICFSMLIGTLLQIIEYQINKQFLYDLEIDELAKKEAEIEKRKMSLLEEKENIL